MGVRGLAGHDVVERDLRTGRIVEDGRQARRDGIDRGPVERGPDAGHRLHVIGASRLRRVGLLVRVVAVMLSEKP